MIRKDSLELAQEHLKRDRELWTGLDKWQQALKEYAEECYRLGERAGLMASDRLNMDFTSQHGAAGGVEEGIHEGFISWTCRLGIMTARGEAADAGELKVVDQRLRYGGGTVATSSSLEKLESSQSLFLELIPTFEQGSGCSEDCGFERPTCPGFATAQAPHRRHPVSWGCSRPMLSLLAPGNLKISERRVVEMNVVLYARVSSERQDVSLSISAQLRALREHADRNGHRVVREVCGRGRERPHC